MSCEESISEPEELSVVGKWFTTRGIEDVYILKTNSNQTANTYNSIGQLNISGSLTGKLYYLDRHHTDYGILRVFEKTGRDEGDNKYKLVININTNEAELHVYDKYPIPIQTFLGNIDFTFDGITLNVYPSIIQSLDDSSTVTISGTISFETITIPKGEFIYISEERYNNNISAEKEFSIIFEFNNDNTGIIFYTDPSEIDTIKFNYSVKEQTLTIPIYYQWLDEMNYELTENELNIIGISKVSDLCYSYSNNDECFSHYEKLFNIEQNSLEELQFGTKITLSKL